MSFTLASKLGEVVAVGLCILHSVGVNAIEQTNPPLQRLRLYIRGPCLPIGPTTRATAKEWAHYLQMGKLPSHPFVIFWRGPLIMIFGGR